MASYTPNYNLKKPADADTYDIADANGNMDLIDTALHSQNQAISTLQEGKLGALQQKQGVSVTTITDSGFYYLANCDDLPYGKYGYLQVYKRLDGYIKQVFQPIDLNRIYTNTYYNNAWVGWEEFALKSDIANKLTICDFSSLGLSASATANEVYAAMPNHSKFIVGLSSSDKIATDLGFESGGIIEITKDTAYRGWAIATAYSVYLFKIGSVLSANTIYWKTLTVS